MRSQTTSSRLAEVATEHRSSNVHFWTDDEKAKLGIEQKCKHVRGTPIVKDNVFAFRQLKNKCMIFGLQWKHTMRGIADNTFCSVKVGNSCVERPRVTTWKRWEAQAL